MDEEMLYIIDAMGCHVGGGTGPSTGNDCAANRRSEALRRPEHPTATGYCKIRQESSEPVFVGLPGPSPSTVVDLLLR